MNVDAQVWTQLNCLKEGGFPTLLWDTLKDFGYTVYPEYSARELMTTGQLLRWEVNVKMKDRYGEPERGGVNGSR
jgi:hypothetical protein